jgi:hypothetical protein
MKAKVFNGLVLVLGVIAAGATGLENVPEGVQPALAAVAVICGGLYRIFSPSLIGKDDE